MKCQDIMKENVVFIREDESAQAAAQLMRAANVGFLPVAGRDGKIIGAITDRDITVRLVADGKPYGTEVREAMNEGVVACDAQDDLTIARDLMAANGISRVIVLESDNRLRGVISASDIADHLGPAEAAPIAEAFYRETRPS